MGLPPCYFKSAMTGAAMKKHFLAVADVSPVPVVLYNMPANTGLDIPPDVCIAYANIAGADCCKLVDLFNAGKHDEARALNHSLIAANAAVTQKFGVPALKVAMEWCGYYR